MPSHPIVRILRSVLPALVLAAAARPASAQNLVTNGSFEAPNIVGGGYQLFGNGSTGITGWTVRSLNPFTPEIQLTPVTYLGLNASNGFQWIDLTGITGYDKGLRSDPIAVMLGHTYSISWDVGNYLPFGMATLGLSLNGGAETLYTNTSLTGPAPMNWMSFSTTWTATSSSLTLDFLGRANGAQSNALGIGLDNVSVQDITPSSTVPEPASVFLMATGLGGVLLVGRRRR
jgi:hypothetical protein